ncbi:MAG: V-type ATP synthase subunit I [Clostridia bacterium]|nr:V-type ATP synthase subunit I [Clostridia bacterium]
MAVVGMKKLTLVGLHDDRHRILSRLMEFGVLDISDTEINPEIEHLFKKEVDSEDIKELEGKISTLASAIDVLRSFDKRKKPLFKVRKDINSHDFSAIVLKRHEVLSMAAKINNIKSELLGVRSDINKRNSSIMQLNSWNALSIPIEASDTMKTEIWKGMLPAAADVNVLLQTMDEEKLACSIDITGTDSDQTYITAYVHKEDTQKVSSILKRNGFSNVSFPGFTGSVGENIEKLGREIEGSNAKIAEIEERLGELSLNLDELEAVFDYYSIRKDISLTAGVIAAGKRAFFLEGWIPESLEKQLFDELNEKWIVDISTREPLEDEVYPVLLKNGFVGDSVQDITNMYDIPSHKAVDPNPVMAPFFILFFGLMLSDAGYGLLMAIGCGAVYFFVKLEDTMKRFMKMMMLCGAATIFWGALFGSWFGNLIPIIQGNPDKDISLWFAPVSDPEYLLMWSLFFGVIHIFTGLGMKAANLIKQKKYLAVLFDVVFWYVFFTGAVFLVMPYVPGISEQLANSLSPYGMYLLGAGAVLLILTQGRKSKNIGGKIIGGLASIYDLINFMSDVLSYSRLLALGLATSVIASIVNEMGSMGGFNFTGIIVFILVFLVGHSINFMLNALGAYVHSSRLQYIEYFSKFYEGGGKPFTPFKRNTKYIRIKD